MCGQDIRVKATGPLPKRCEVCRQRHNREQQARYQATLNVQRATREVKCVDCGTELSWVGTGRPRKRCTPCLAEWSRTESIRRSREWTAADPERAREKDRRGYWNRVDTVRQAKLDEHLRRKYGMERADYDRMVEEQGNRCLICQRQPEGNRHHGRLHVDHCHTSGRVRGLLCGNCNTMIGLAGEDSKVLLAAVEYLEKG
jgi:hypothetical protein